MRILLLTQWYSPIKAAAARRTAKIASHLASRGHEITVLTGMPSYPTGNLPFKYRGKVWCKEKEGKVRIIRTYEYPTPNKGVLKRLFNNFTFLFSSSIAALLLPKHDAVIFSSPSFISGISALIFKSINGCDFYIDVRDLWPDSAIELGFLRQKFLIKIFQFLEKLYYKKAKTIFVATPQMKRHLVSEKIPEEKIQVLLNSIDTNLFKPQKIRRSQFGFKESDFVCCYVGNHSYLYGLETVLNAALLLNKNKKIKFIFVGEGEEKEKLIDMKKKMKLENVTFFPEKDSNEVSRLVNMSDAALIPLRNIPVSQNSVPMKASEYLGCGKPIVASISGDFKKMLLETNSGLIYQPENHIQLKEKLLTLLDKPNLRKKMAKNARKLALEAFSNQTFFKILDKNFAK